MMRVCTTLPIAIAAAILLLGCESKPGCAEMCARQFECRQDFDVIPAGDPEQCTADCEALSAEDPDFAEAVADRAECLQDADCESVAFGIVCNN